MKRLLFFLFAMLLAISVYPQSNLQGVQLGTKIRFPEEEKKMIRADRHTGTLHLYESLTEVREMHGLPELKVSKSLEKQCERYARKLAKSGTFYHNSRLKVGVSECLHEGSVTPVSSWYESKKGHKKIILSKHATEVGIGMAWNGDTPIYVLRTR